MGLYWIPPANRFMCSGRSRTCGIMRGAICWKYSASSPLVMPSAGKRTVSGWVTVISRPSTSGIVGLSCNSLSRLRGRVGVRVFNPGTFENGGDEVRLRKGADEGSLAIDDGMGNAADSELVREVREFVRFNADRAHLRRRQGYPVSQAHGPGTVGSSRRRKDHDLSRLGQLRQCLHAFLAQAVLHPRDAFHGVDQGRELGAGRQALEPDAPGCRVRGNGDRWNLRDLVGERAFVVASDVDHLQRDLFRGGVPQQLRHLTRVLAGGAANARREDQARRPRPRVEREMNRASKRGLEPVLELLTNLFGNERHMKVIPDI